MVVNVYNRYLFLYMKKSTAGTWLAADLSLRLIPKLSDYETLDFCIRHSDEIHTSWDRYNFAKLVIE